MVHLWFVLPIDRQGNPQRSPYLLGSDHAHTVLAISVREEVGLVSFQPFLASLEPQSINAR
jgi:hypothetical protein